MTSGRMVALVVVVLLTGGVAGYKAWMMLQLRHEEPGASRRAGLGALHSLLIGVSGVAALAIRSPTSRYAVWIVVAMALSWGLSIWWDRRQRAGREVKDR